MQGRQAGSKTGMGLTFDVIQGWKEGFWRRFVLFSYDMFQGRVEMFVLGDRGMGHALFFITGRVEDQGALG